MRATDFITVSNSQNVNNKTTGTRPRVTATDKGTVGYGELKTTYSSAKSAAKKILQDLFPDSFRDECPRTVQFAAEDGSFFIHTLYVGERTTPRQLATQMLSRVNAMFTKHNTDVYYMAFDIPEIVPPNKSETQNDRRSGKDELGDSDNIPRLTWPGRGPFMTTGAEVDHKAWPRLKCHSGRKAFRQMMTDLFGYIMAHYRPPAGKTLLISGMHSHPCKRTGRIKTCRKVYALRGDTDFSFGQSVTATHGSSDGNKGARDAADDETDPEMASEGTPEDAATVPCGRIPEIEIMPDSVRYSVSPKEIPEAMERCLSDYHARYHQTVREFRLVVPGLRMRVGEAEMAMFHVALVLTGNVTSLDGCADLTETREWLLGSALSLRTTVGRPTMMMRSADTDILSIGLACASIMEKERPSRGGYSGWVGKGKREPSATFEWRPPLFDWDIHLHLWQPGGWKTKSKAGEPPACGGTKRSAEYCDLAKLYNDALKTSNAKPDYTCLPASSSADREVYFYKERHVHDLILAIKLGGDDYITERIEGVPMQWYVRAYLDSHSDPCVVQVHERFHSPTDDPDGTLPIEEVLLETKLNAESLMSMLKRAVIKCYKLQDLTKHTDSMKRVSDIVKEKRNPKNWLPCAPYYPPQAMRLMWVILYNTLGLVNPDRVPDCTQMGWRKVRASSTGNETDGGTGTETHYIENRVPDGSYAPDTINKREEVKEKSRETRKRKIETKQPKRSGSKQTKTSL